MRTLTVALIAGETSGDILGAGLIKALKAEYPAIRCVGVAGPLMQAEGCEVWYEMETLSVMGLVEILGRLPELLMIRRDVTRRVLQLKPDILIGIDSPEFNLHVEGIAKRQGIKTIHYVSPSVWAWRQKRVHKIARNTDLVLAFLPFEKTFYDKFNVPCRFIGHTMADAIAIEPDKQAARAALGIAPEASCLALLPGSRRAEVALLSADFIQAAKRLKQRLPGLQIWVPLVDSARMAQFRQINEEIAPELVMNIIEGNARTVMIASDAAILASGTAALECMLAKCPMVVGYKMKPLTFWLAKKLVKTRWVSLPNLLARREIVLEFLQEACSPQALAEAIEPLLQPSAERQALLTTFTELHQKIRWNADKQAADAVLEVLNDHI